MNESVEVYWNLHKGCLSARPTRRGGKVTHVDSAWLTDVRFSVQPAGNARVRAEGRKNVHAFVRGDVVNWAGRGFGPWNDSDVAAASVEAMVRLGWVRVTYNPYRDDSFVVASTGEPVFEAREAYVADRQVWALL